MRRTTEIEMNKITSIMVAIKMIFSAPRLVAYVLLSPPNVPERPAPRCCSSIEMIKRIATMVCAMVIGVI